MTWIFFASVAVFIWLFGLGRKMMLEADRAKQTAKILYNDSHTLYLDGRPYTGGAVIHSRSEREHERFHLQGGRDN